MISNTSSFTSGSRRAQPASQAIKEVNVGIFCSFLHMTACRVSGNLLLQCYISTERLFYFIFLMMGDICEPSLFCRFTFELVSDLKPFFLNCL